MARRDGDLLRRRFVLFVLPMVLGVAAVVGIDALTQSLLQVVDANARILLSGDASVTGRQPFDAETEVLLDQLHAERRSREIRTSSVVYFPQSEKYRLCQLRAVDQEFPLFGELRSEPPGASSMLRSHNRGEDDGVLVEESLQLQFGLNIGSEIRIGSESFRVAGILKSVPGEIVATSYLGPRIYLSYSAIGRTGLIKKGSLARYRTYLAFGADDASLERFSRLRPELEKRGLQVDTASERVRNLGNTVRQVSSMLSLAGLCSVVLGLLAVGGSIALYLREKQEEIAVLRCLGTRSREIFTIYLLQVLLVGVVSLVLGSLLALILVRLLPFLIAPYFAMTPDFAGQVSFTIGVRSLVLGILVGIGGVAVVSLAPLLSARALSPLLALRLPFDVRHQALRQRIVAMVAGFVFLVFVSCVVTRRADQSLGFTAGVVLGFVILAAVVALLGLVLRRSVGNQVALEIKHGVLGLFRPGNQTAIVGGSIGFAAAFAFVILILEASVYNENRRLEDSGQANLVLFDIQPEQRQGVRAVIEALGLTVMQDVPIAMMRLVNVNGRSAEELSSGPDAVDSWTLNRDYGSTYRRTLVAGERVLEGKWHAGELGADGTIGISLEVRMAERLKVKLGDALVFNLQGVEYPTVISSIREVDWRYVQPNSFVVFPLGVLEQAPQFFVAITRAPNAQLSTAVQKDVVQKYPNVSVMDIGLIVELIDSVLSKLTASAGVVALVSCLSSLIVVASAVALSRDVRAVEGARWILLGATRARVRRIFTIEFLLLGILGGIGGIVLALPASWLIATQLLKVKLVLPYLALALALAVTVIASTAIAALFGTRVRGLSPLELVRSLR